MTKDAMHKNVDIKIKRQDSPTAVPRWELFSIPYKPNMNIIICLLEIQRNPITKFGHKTTPPVWDCNCLEEVCGACTMVINGRVRQACSTLVDTIEHPIIVEPMSKFPLVRDLIVDRSKMFEALKRVRAWAPIDGTHEQGPGARIPAKTAEEAYWLSRCMTCGCCLEACPQINERSSFIGAAAISQVRLFNMTARGEGLREERLDALMSEGGIADCGNAQNCEKVCPKSIPLVRSIAEVNRDITKEMLTGWMRR